MKSKRVRTIISIAFVVGTIAIIVYDARSRKESSLGVKQDSSKVDSSGARK